MALLTDDMQGKLISLLTSEGLIERSVVKEAQKRASESGKPLLSLLTEEHLLENELLVHAVAQLSGVPYVNLASSVIEQHILNLLPEDVAERFMAVPLAEVQGRLAVAMIDANNVQAVDYLANRIQRPLKVFMASEESIRHVLGQYKTDLSSVNEAAEDSQREALDESSQNIVTIVQDSPISRALSTILEYAVKSHASDVHIEPLEKALKIRCRVDGVLREIMQLPKSIEPALVSRIKILSNLKIDEHRIPQDGQFAVNVAGKDVDLRIAISPGVWGEQVVIRLLDKTGNSFDLTDMGYAGRALRAIQKGIKRPSGMILTSGPTGSGKSTSLYALIKEIKDDSINIVTLEDPVEYKIDGVNQIQVHADVGLTFASGLRSILRQDPDVVMVGEIRDTETANLAVQAALTGHLVFSTLHTNNAATCLPRLLDMGIEPFLIASTVKAVIGQRLVRRLCMHCRQQYVPDAGELAYIVQMFNLKQGSMQRLHALEQQAAADKIGGNTPLGSTDVTIQYLWRPNPEGCDECGHNGFKGRVGIYEVLGISIPIQKMITANATSNEIQQQAITEGMVTMQTDGFIKSLRGVTTLEEVLRATREQ